MNKWREPENLKKNGRYSVTLCSRLPEVFVMATIAYTLFIGSIRVTETGANGVKANCVAHSLRTC